MSAHITLTSTAEDPAGMTLAELHARLGEMLAAGAPGDQIVRVRTRFAANKHGAAVKSVTTIDTRPGIGTAGGGR